MKTAVVLSDTHGNRARVNALLPLMREADFVFFCGDGIYDLLSLNEAFPENCMPSAATATDAEIRSSFWKSRKRKFF